jgi:hypothetical protein
LYYLVVLVLEQVDLVVKDGKVLIKILVEGGLIR